MEHLTSQDERRAQAAHARRMRTEREIAERIVRAFLGAGLALSVDDGERGYFVKDSRDEGEILGAMFAMDEDRLYITPAAGVGGFVWLVYGNGLDVIADYDMRLQDVLQPINAWIDAQEEA